MKLRFCICVVLLIPFSLIAQDNGKWNITEYSPQQLIEDWRIFRKALTEAHPAVYRFTKKENFDFFFDSVTASFKTPLTEAEFVKLLMLGVAKVRCVHTRADFSEEYYKSRPIATTTILPLNFKYINNEAYIKRHVGRDSITNILGLKVNRINGRSMKSYTEEFYPLLTSDGYIQTSRCDQLGNDFNDFYMDFIGHPDTFYLDCENLQTSEQINLIMPAVSIQELITKNKGRNKGKKPLEYKILDNKTAYIKMNSFEGDYLRKQKQNPYKFLKSSFKNIREEKVENLIIDIRKNGGGQGRLGARLYSYLADSSFTPDRSQVVKLIRFDKEYLQYREKKNGVSRIKRMYVTKTDSGYYSVWNRFTKMLAPWEPKKNPFKGSVYLLVSGSTYSAASEFATIFNEHKRGQIIGEEVGGQAYGGTGAWPLYLVLPNTKARVKIPLVSKQQNVKSYIPGRGVMPKNEINEKLRIQCLIEGLDPEMEYTLKLISEKK